MFKNFARHVCEGDRITCELDGGFTATAMVYRDDNSDPPYTRQDGFWPSRDPKNAGYVPRETFDAAQALAERVMRAWEWDQWFYCGIAVTVAKNGVELTGKYDHALWGVEANYPDSDNTYLTEVANELLSEAMGDARAKLAALCDAR